MKLWGYIRQKMLEHPTQTISEKGVTMTYQEILDKVACFSLQLNGIECCAIYCQSELFAAIALLSCFAAGTTAVPLPSRYGDKYCRKIIEKVQPTSIILDDFGKLTVHTSVGNHHKTPVKPALIMCTSGTTGTPKGIQLSEKIY